MGVGVRQGWRQIRIQQKSIPSLIDLLLVLLILCLNQHIMLSDVHAWLAHLVI